MDSHSHLRYNRVMEEGIITEPTHSEDYILERWRRFVDEPKQSHWVWEYYITRVGNQIKTTEQIYVETTLDNHVKANKRRKSSTGYPEPNVRFED